MTWKITFFNDQVENQALKMPDGIRVRFLKLLEIMTLRGPDLGMPHTKALGNGLFEIRAKASEGIGRFFYCTQIGQEIVVLHSFIKKTQHIPERHIVIARNRLKELKS